MTASAHKPLFEFFPSLAEWYVSCRPHPAVPQHAQAFSTFQIGKVSAAPIVFKYRITKLGASLRELLTMLYNWSLFRGVEVRRAQVKYDASRKQGGDADQGG